MAESESYGKVSLAFPRNDGAEAGFASPHVDRESVTEEVVVRELLQNALDASLTGESVRVEFRHESVPTQDLPLIKDYMATFNAARYHRRNKVDSPAERQAIDRIRGCLQSENRLTGVLACIDWGQGIDATALRHLYNTGDTTKRTGRGSVGLGHLTAFAVSDLRYVLYAGRDVSGRETFGGHAILATSSGDGLQRDAHGYIRGAQEHRQSPASQACGSPVVPEPLKAWLPEDGAPGSVAAIVGYARTASADSVEASLLAAAAKSFVVAVHQGQLSVTCRVNGSERASLGPGDLAAVLSRVRDQQRRRLGRGVRGRDAWAAYETLQTGASVSVGEDLDGVSIWVRELAAGDRTLVCVFREGMWITSQTRHLQSHDFPDLAPFCAVVNVEDPSAEGDEESVCALVREAEGETHSQIRPTEITDRGKQQRLVEALGRIAEVLREHGRPAAGRTVEPDDLRIFHGRLLTPAPSPPPRPPDTDKEDPPDDEDPPDEIADIYLGGDDGGGGTGGGGGTDGGGQRPGTGPAPRRISARGSSSGIRVASRHLGGRRWDVAWRAKKLHASGIRVMAVLPSGADETTERQIDDTVLKIASVTVRGHAHYPVPDSRGSEVRLPWSHNAGEARVELAADITPTDAATVRIRIMHARGSTA